MTPSTVKGGFVSAILNASYHVELAGGGHYNPKALCAKVAEIQAQIPAGVGLTLNSLYINPRQFNFQLPLWQEMCREGLPIEGFCVAAGIPSIEKASETSTVLGRPASGMSHSNLAPSRASGRSLALLLLTPTIPSSCNRPVVALEVTIHARTSTSPSSRLMVLSVSTPTSFLSAVLDSVVRTTSGRT